MNLASGGGTQSGLLALRGKRRFLATGKGISLPLNKAVLYSLRNWRRLEFLVPHQQKQTSNKPPGWMHIKTLTREIQLMLRQSVHIITNTLFGKMGPLRLQNYCFKPSSYTTEEDDAGFICT